MIERPSPNHDSRAGRAVDLLLIHYTGMADAAAALARLCDPAAAVSAHYLIDEDGASYRLVDEGLRAWHAGVASWAGATDINHRSVGIELVNPGHEFGYRPFPEGQMAALIDLGRDIVRRHGIPAGRVLGHADVAPTRRRDPGELFDWPALARAGLGLWPAPAEPQPSLGPGAAVREVQAALAEIGYGIDVTGDRDDLTRAVVTAFQRHFRPGRVDGRADGETRGRIAAVRAAVRGST